MGGSQARLKVTLKGSAFYELSFSTNFSEIDLAKGMLWLFLEKHSVFCEYTQPTKKGCI